MCCEKTFCNLLIFKRLKLTQHIATLFSIFFYTPFRKRISKIRHPPTFLFSMC